jgi:hypothetical protein
MSSSSSGMPFSKRTGRVTRYTIWPVGTGGPGLPRTTARHTEFNPAKRSSIGLHVVERE